MSLDLSARAAARNVRRQHPLHRTLAACAILAVGAASAPAMASTPSAPNILCDPDDTAAVVRLNAAVLNQIADLVDTLQAMSDVIDAAELANREAQTFLNVNEAQLRLDIEQLLLKTCAPECAKAPAPPAAPAAPRPVRSARCWTCTNPRLMLPSASGGFLEEVLEVVGDDVEGAIAVGLPLDVARAQALIDEASAAFLLGEFERSFTLSCQAFGTLACDETVNRVTSRPLDGFAGGRLRRR